MKTNFLSALMLLCVAVFGAADRYMMVDSDGVMRFVDNGEEVALFGVNYYPPFSIDYSLLKSRGIDHKEAILQDLAHFQRIGIKTLRLHCFERQFSDGEGNMLDNIHLELLDFLVDESAKRDIYVIMTPIAWWGSPVVQPGCFASRYKTIREMIADRAAWRCMARFLEQFGKHVNRYNGKTYANDPAIPFFELINEPLYTREFKDEDITAFINALYDGLRASGTKKAIFYNCWGERFQACADAKIEGVSHVSYPTGLVAGYTLTANYLGKVAKYRSFDDKRIQKKAKMIYEFDCADVHQTTMYPAMACAFRGAGVQAATQFQYDVLAIAAENLNWQTHYLNLCYTPGKAMGFAIAAEVFKRIPRGFDAGEYPKSLAFDAFKLSYEDDLAEMVTETEFLFTNNTKTIPPNPKALTRVWGVGESPVASSTSTGAFFLDKMGDGDWLFETYPDAIIVRDPYGGGAKEKVRLAEFSNDFKLTLPDLGSEFTVTRLDRTAPAQRTTNGSFTAKPGQYRLVRQGVQAGALPKSNRDFLLPKMSEIDDQVLMAIDTPTQFMVGEKPLIVKASGFIGKNCSRLELVLEGVRHKKAIRLPMDLKREKAVFKWEVPASELNKTDIYRVWIEHTANGKVTCLPTGRGRNTSEPAFGTTWPAIRIDENTPVPDDHGEEPYKVTYKYDKEGNFIRMAATGYGEGRAASKIWFNPIPPPAGVPVTGIRVRVRGGEFTTGVELGLKHDEKHAYGMDLSLSQEWQDLDVPFQSTKTLWGTIDGEPDADAIKVISLITGTWLFSELREKPHFVDFQQADWIYAPEDIRVNVVASDSALPVISEFESARVPRLKYPLHATLVQGSEPGRRALRITAGSFLGTPSHGSVSPPFSPVFKKLLKPGKQYTHLVVTARALYPWTNKAELTLTESDGSVWGTQELPLTTSWEDIRFPLDKLYLFKHWGKMPPNRGGEDDQVNLDQIIRLSFCIGKFLYGDNAGKPHGLEIQEIKVE